MRYPLGHTPPRDSAAMGGSRWADAEDDESAPAPAPKPLSVSLSKSRSLGDRPTSFCRSCGCCFYSNKRGKPRFHCRPCYVAWREKQGQTSHHTTPSPASSSRDGSSGGDDAPREKTDVNADGLVLGLQRVLTRGVSFEEGSEPPPTASPEEPVGVGAEPPPPQVLCTVPPPVPSAEVPEPTDISALLHRLAQPPTVRPTTVDRGCQTGRTPPPCRSIAPVPRAF